VEDVGEAIDEITQGAGVVAVALVGFRLGGSLAARVAVERGGVDDVVLWDPVLLGSEWLRESEARHADFTRGGFSRKGPTPRSAEDGREILGFELPDPLRAETARIDLLACATRPARRALVLSSSESPRADALARRYSELGVDTRRHVVGTAPVWLKADQEITDAAPVPIRVVDEIARWMENETGGASG
jgi:pimeloyl-ACP methyl ester carboxylesterase